jgi:hypothetical protein
MSERFFQLVELLFTAYAVPALIVPFVWLARRLIRARRRRPFQESAARLSRLEAAYALLAAGWFTAWLALRLGVPIEAGGHAVGALFWSAYAALNVVLAWLLVRFTAGYGELEDGRSKDRLFLRFLSVVIAQPFATACAFAVLFRIMGVVYRMKVPGLTAVQEGI